MNRRIRKNFHEQVQDRASAIIASHHKRKEKTRIKKESEAKNIKEQKESEAKKIKDREEKEYRARYKESVAKYQKRLIMN